MIRKLITLSLVANLLVPPVAATAAERAERPAARPGNALGWLATRSSHRAGPGGDYSSRAFVRFVQGRNLFPVAQVVSFSVPRSVMEGSKHPFHPDRYAADLSEAMGIGFERRREGKAWVFEGHWEAGNRFMRVYAWAEGASWKTSVAFVRMGFLEPLALETELLQRSLANELSPGARWFDRLISSAADLFWIPEAQAQDAGCPDSCPPGPGYYSCMVRRANCAADKADSAGDGFGDATKELGELRDEISNINSTTQQALGDVKAGMQDMKAMTADVVKQWDRTNDQLTRSNDLIEKFLNPGHAFVLAAAGAAGAAVGAMAVGLAVEGIMAGGRALIDLFTGESEHKRLIARFREGREHWQKLTETAAALEKVIDSAISLKEIQRAYGMDRSQLLTQLEPALVLARNNAKERDAALSATPNTPENADCRMQIAKEVVRYEAEAESLNSLLRTLREDAGEQAFCRQLGAKLDELSMAEGMLQTARGKILGGEEAWQKEFEEEQEELEKDLRRSRERAGKIRDQAVAHAESRAKRRRAEARNAYYNNPVRTAWVDRCWDDERDFFQSIPIFSAVAGTFEVRNRCMRKYDQGIDPRTRLPREMQLASEQAEIQQDEVRERIAARENYNSKMTEYDRTLASSSVTTNEKLATTGWFKRLREDQACLHASDAEGPSSTCGLVSSLRRMNRKQARIDQLCADVRS
ncbi:MAG: hypothetical protein IT285_06655 [Bdellovibrionales bacterium]|nr:hypothetical protein [Bdellovibrionales bacterium]